MRRDQILRQPPVITGNLPPADLPNPHEPIRSEETLDGRAGNWKEPHHQTVRQQGSSMPYMQSDGAFSQQHAFEGQVVELSNGQNGHINNFSADEEQPREAAQSTRRRHWLARILHITAARSR